MTRDDAAAGSISTRDAEILAINQSMLEGVLRGDWNSYAAHCSDDISCFEAETNGVLVEGKAFHRFYFADDDGSNTGSSAPPSAQVIMARPHVRWLSDDVVVLSYTRLVQRLSEGVFSTNSCCETRIWQRCDGRWQQVHVHRS